MTIRRYNLVGAFASFDDATRRAEREAQRSGDKCVVRRNLSDTGFVVMRLEPSPPDRVLEEWISDSLRTPHNDLPARSQEAGWQSIEWFEREADARAFLDYFAPRAKCGRLVQPGSGNGFWIQVPVSRDLHQRQARQRICAQARSHVDRQKRLPEPIAIRCPVCDGLNMSCNQCFGTGIDVVVPRT